MQLELARCTVCPWVLGREGRRRGLEGKEGEGGLGVLSGLSSAHYDKMIPNTPPEWL